MPTGLGGPLWSANCWLLGLRPQAAAAQLILEFFLCPGFVWLGIPSSVCNPFLYLRGAGPQGESDSLGPCGTRYHRHTSYRVKFPSSLRHIARPFSPPNSPLMQ